MALAFLAAAALRSESHVAQPGLKMCVCVRKRPLNKKELKRQEHDCLTVANPYAVIHESQTSVDQYKFLKHIPFQFDHVFDEESETGDVYVAAIKPLVDFMLEGGYATVFAYGQYVASSPVMGRHNSFSASPPVFLNSSHNSFPASFSPTKNKHAGPARGRLTRWGRLRHWQFKISLSHSG